VRVGGDKLRAWALPPSPVNVVSRTSRDVFFSSMLLQTDARRSHLGAGHILLGIANPWSSHPWPALYATPSRRADNRQQNQQHTLECCRHSEKNKHAPLCNDRSLPQRHDRVAMNTRASRESSGVWEQMRRRLGLLHIEAMQYGLITNRDSCYTHSLPQDKG